MWYDDQAGGGCLQAVKLMEGDTTTNLELWRPLIKILAFDGIPIIIARNVVELLVQFSFSEIAQKKMVEVSLTVSYF